MAKKWIILSLVVFVLTGLAGGFPAYAQAEGASLKTDLVVRIPVNYAYISQGFWSGHPGIDMASQLGESVFPIMPGTVVKAEKDGFGYGNLVVVAHSGGYESWYAHLSRIDVQTGQEVDTDTVLGLIGSTGHSTGPHLHLEVHLAGTPIDPRRVLGIN